jgi:hypothetical protein
MEVRSGGVNVAPAMIAGVRRTARYAVMLRNPLTDLAFNTIRVQRLPQPLQAGGIVGKLSFEIADGVLNCLSYYEVPKLSVMDLR